MKILNFFPLAAWSIALLFVPKVEPKNADAFGSVYLFGCVFWLVVAIVCY